jgi:hypothetical protein
MGNHKVEFISLHCSFQYGPKSKAFPVKARSDISDDFRSGLKPWHLLDLPFEVVFLGRGGDSALTDCLGFFLPLEIGVDIEKTLTCGIANGWDKALISILA